MCARSIEEVREEAGEAAEACAVCPPVGALPTAPSVPHPIDNATAAAPPQRRSDRKNRGVDELARMRLRTT
jgi:hypothetical protein